MVAELTVFCLCSFLVAVCVYSFIIRKKARMELVTAINTILKAGGCIVYDNHHLYKDKQGRAIVLGFNMKSDLDLDKEFEDNQEAINYYIKKTGIE